jgi:hypothetical protein
MTITATPFASRALILAVMAAVLPVGLSGQAKRKPETPDLQRDQSLKRAPGRCCSAGLSFGARAIHAEAEF